MDDRTRLLVCVGASLAANCAPCFEHYLAKAVNAGIDPDEIRDAMEAGNQIQRGARIAMQAKVAEITTQHAVGQAREADPTECCGR
jgi:AhpD family alkylhydroperoxidase